MNLNNVQFFRRRKSHDKYNSKQFTVLQYIPTMYLLKKRICYVKKFALHTDKKKLYTEKCIFFFVQMYRLYVSQNADYSEPVKNR